MNKTQAITLEHQLIHFAENDPVNLSKPVLYSSNQPFIMHYP